MTTNTKIIAVVGATGAQGGGLARALQAGKAAGFVPRALTRNPAGEKGRALAAQGIEVRAADLDSPASLEAAFDGAYGAFCVTNFWEHFSAERELMQAKNLAHAAAQAHLQHVVWSTLEDTRKSIPLTDNRMPTLQGKYKVVHFDAKAEADEFFRAAGVPTTFLLTSFYWENFIHSGLGPKAGHDGKLAITLPMGNAKLPGIAAEDIGRCAAGVFAQGPAALAGRYVGIAGEHLTGAEMAGQMGGALGTPVAYNAVEPEVFRHFGFPGAEDLGNMFQYNRDFSAAFCAARNLAGARALNPELQTFARWLGENAARIPIG
jgi:uncharacterized protein YbjT (DUF2867 family)